MTIRVIIRVPESQSGPVAVRRQPVDGVPFDPTPLAVIAPGGEADFTVWGASALQISEG